MPAQLKLKPEEAFYPAATEVLPRLGPNLTEAKAHDPVASPALVLQSALAEAFEVEPRWSARRTLAFAILTCGAFWAGVGLVAVRVLAH
jgi:hypothetical protein